MDDTLANAYVCAGTDAVNSVDSNKKTKLCKAEPKIVGQMGRVHFHSFREVNIYA